MHGILQGIIQLASPRPCECDTRSAKQTLARPLSEQELLQVAKEMATGKSPGPNGYAIEYYTRMWRTIGAEFTEMVNAAMVRG
jgi:hypothetical protein